MILIYGKGKVGKGLSKFLKITNQKFQIADDVELDINKNQKKLSKTQLDFLEQFEKIIVSPGIPPHHPIYQNFGNKIVSELNFLGEYLEQSGFRDKLIIVGISGTNGKSTTTHITYHLLKQIIEDKKNKTITNINIFLSGNFGTPLSETLTEIIKYDNKKTKNIIITECSSFMLYKLKNFYFDYSILTNIEIDHLDRHKDKEDYKIAKENLMKFTTKKAYTTKKIFQKLDIKLQNKTKIFGYDYALNKTQFVGHHNKGNIQSAYLLTQGLLSDLKSNSINIKEYIKNIKPLEHRMQLYTTIDNIDIYDDAICTSAHAQENALKGLGRKVVLICGGYDKGDDFEYLTNLYKDKVEYGIFIGHTAPKFKKIFSKQNINFSTQKTLHNAIQEAFNYAKSHKKSKKIDIVFSPACASFDMFKNVYHRIKEFEKEIKILQNQN